MKRIFTWVMVALLCASVGVVSSCSDDDEKEKISVEKQWVLDNPEEPGSVVCYDFGVTIPGSMLAGINNATAREWAAAAGYIFGENDFAYNDEPGPLLYKIVATDATSGKITLTTSDGQTMQLSYSELTVSSIKLNDGSTAYTCVAKKCKLYEVYPPKI